MLRTLTKSLRTRLTAGFIALTLVAAALASTAAWYEARHSLNKLFDTQQLLFAKRLSVLDFDTTPGAEPQLPRSKSMIKKHRGKLDDDTLAFAIFSADGRLVLNDGDSGKGLTYSWHRDGFVDGQLANDDDLWRLVWLTTQDGRYRIVVGQEWDYRDEMALDIVSSQLAPWLIALPLMLILLIWLVSSELAPLSRLAQKLQRRSPGDTTRLETTDLPLEVKPLAEALNQLFERTNELMQRERRFTSDAAHELRSPLAALKIQAEVAQLAEQDAPVREQALINLHQGIDRASRLVEQLLTLSRLDSLDELNDVQSISLQALLQEAVMEAWHNAQREGVDIRLKMQNEPVIHRGQPLLLGLMLRNILDNAVRYSPPGSIVQVILRGNSLEIIDNGPGVSPEHLASLGQRFFRPPGQLKNGSGLGLSIVKRIAALHGMNAAFGNAQDGGFRVLLSWS
ncbi:Sensor protein qseC [Cedecea davisae]|uniref:Sensor protein QseC n=1 Tax=Cedecea davisae DSM 4568 TaxID=566551 RepID=S3J1L2_9ENTR|nr:quorum sensing histidine kinase QseC [Cedecea davisae]EPF13822.1 sensor protein QseC [Cedecea davisae DSM 4568]SUX37690.1 Sensor protein qseC [Cedecea davisae]